MHVKTYCLQSKYLQLESIPNASRDAVNGIPRTATERTIWPNYSPIASGNAPITSCTVAFGRDAIMQKRLSFLDIFVMSLQ